MTRDSHFRINSAEPEQRDPPAAYGQEQSVLQLSEHWELSGQEYQHLLKVERGQLDYLRPVSLASCTYQSSGPSSGSVHLLLLWSKTRPSVHPSSFGVMENSHTMYFLHEEGWANEG